MRRRTIVWTFAGLMLALGVAGWAWRAPLAMKLFERAVAANAGVDRSAALPDGLHAFLCGTGTPMPDAERAGPCIAVIAGKDAFLFDAGSGSVRKLLRMGFPADKLRAGFLTHLHSDHFDGLGELLLQAWIAGGRGAPLPVYGPEGVVEVVEGFNRAYALDRGFRIAHHGPQIARPGGFGGEPRVIRIPVFPALPDGVEPIEATTAYEHAGVTITAIRVDHAPVRPALGYRIDYKGRSLAISGDTAFSPNLARAAKGVDVLFHEALEPRMVAMLARALDKRGRKDAAQVMRDIPDYHASPEQAARVAQAAGAKALVLYHLAPSIPAGVIEAAFVGNAGKRFDGTLMVGRDGLLVSLPAGSRAVEFDHAL